MHPDNRSDPFEQLRSWTQERMADALPQLQEAVLRLRAEIGRTARLLSLADEVAGESAGAKGPGDCQP